MRDFFIAVGFSLLATQIQAGNQVIDLAKAHVGHEASRVEVDQITDPKATAVTGMFRFDPAIVYLDPGSAVVFLNSRGEHTVHSAMPLWPEGKDPVAIVSQKKAEVRFETPGVYGFRCKRHGLYGMAMLVIVGETSKIADPEPQISQMKARPMEKAAFRALWAEHLAAH